MQEKRTENFKRNENLDLFLKEINADLLTSEKEVLKNVGKQKYPIIFIVGSLRVGSTLLTQWLTATEEIICPTNMLSRFYGAPIIGAKIQRLLTDEKYNFRNEILDFNSTQNYQSENGKTRGALSPNDFWFFWKRFIPYDTEIGFLKDEELWQLENIGMMRDELIGVTDVFEKPFALKGKICNYNIGFLDKMFDKALFLFVKRNPCTHIESILQAREKQLGDRNKWYSFKIPEYPELIKIENPIKQIAGQIYYTHKAVETGLEKVAEDKKMIIEYEDFCENPEKYYQEMVQKLGSQGYEMSPIYKGEKRFEITRKNIDPEIEKYYNEYMSEIKNV